ncbi:MAG: hypothetical protein K1000chlam1_00561 [Candidatus Anoxychlamydiales bacterium]|nr:hypothetical protein [Candidatus Anoxychlamydiales bacterium]
MDTLDCLNEKDLLIAATLNFIHNIVELLDINNHGIILARVRKTIIHEFPRKNKLTPKVVGTRKTINYELMLVLLIPR